jgi:predicted nucleic acid-binding Zn ribbon protein
MRCAHCDVEFTAKNSRRRFCSSRCRAASWQRNRQAELAILEAQLTWALTRVRVLQGTAKDRA